VFYAGLSSKSRNYYGTSCYCEDDADSDTQDLNALLPSARPDTGNEGRTGLRFGEELPPGRLVKDYIRDTNREEERSEEEVVWQRSDHLKDEGHPDSKHYEQYDNPAHRHLNYLCSKSTGAVTSYTRKYLASAGYFRATASYIA
jgi:hypothetical protein